MEIAGYATTKQFDCIIPLVVRMVTNPMTCVSIQMRIPLQFVTCQNTFYGYFDRLEPNNLRIIGD